MIGRGIVLAVTLLLAACGGGEDEEDALSADEDRQLNEAAEMLDEPEEDGGEDTDREGGDEGERD